VTGTLFSGWTHDSDSEWQGTASTGNWSVSANYTGKPGIGNTLTVTGGEWFLSGADVAIIGKLTSGTVTWPPSLTTKVLGSDCGQGVGYISVALVSNEGQQGNLTGCLDDTHVVLGTFPPKVWGTLELR
jgi:hypothetical protein